jgi:hypothetical protein
MAKCGQNHHKTLIRKVDGTDAGPGTDAHCFAMDGTQHPSPHPARRVATALLALVALIVGTGTALAADDAGGPPQARWPVGGAGLATASELAAAHWGATPCHGRVTISWARLGVAVNGASDWAFEGTDPYGDAAENSDCSIRLSSDADWDWRKLCTVVVHEVGHLTGHDHVADVHDVMSPQYAEPVAECAATDEPGGDAAVLSSYLSAPGAPAALVAPAVARPKATAKPKAAPKRRRAKARPARIVQRRHAARRQA